MTFDSSSDRSSMPEDLRDHKDREEIDGIAEEGALHDANAETFELHEETAPSYGTLEVKSFKLADEEMKRLQARVVQALRERRPMSWEEVLEVFSEDPELEADVTSAGHCYPATFTIDPKWRIRWDEIPDTEDELKVEEWFRQLVHDEDVLQSSKTVPKQLSQIVATQNAVMMNSFMTFLYHAEDTSRSQVRVGILRYPHPHSMYYIVYRIRLRPWAKCEAYGLVQHDTSGIDAEYNCQVFRPRADILKQIQSKIQAQAVVDVVDGFSEDPGNTAQQKVE